MPKERIAKTSTPPLLQPVTAAFVACAVLLAMLHAWPAIAGDGFEYQGVVLSASEGQIVLKVGTEDFRFLAPADAKVTLDGAPAKLEQIQEGFLATIQADRRGEEFIARQITAKHAQLPRP